MRRGPTRPASPSRFSWVWGALLLVTLWVVASGCSQIGTAPTAETRAENLTSCGAEGLIDDGEDGNNQTRPAADRGGYWYTFTEGRGTTMTPEPGAIGGGFAMTPGGVNGSKFAANAHGHVTTGSAVFGALGLNFSDPFGPYDASRYQGVRFWAKSGPGGFRRVRFKIPDTSTHEAGGTCKDCFNDFGMAIELSESWQQFSFSWRDLKQLPGWGSPRPHGIKPNKVFGLQWQVSQPDADFDIWIDDVEFIGCR